MNHVVASTPRTSNEPLGTKRSLRDVSATHDDGVVINGVSKAFGHGNDRTSVVEDISVRIDRGQFVTLIGPSGCGKSTLLRIVAGLLSPDRGSVSIFGETVTRAAESKHIGFVPQTPALLPWRTVIENVELPLHINKRDSARDVGLSRDPRELLERFGLGRVLHRRPHELSGGMQQRVAIARAFVFDPMILLMDEPFSALDELAREAQRHGLLELWQSNRKTVLFVTHSVTEAVELSDVIVVMSSQPGRIQKVIPVNLPRPRRSSAADADTFHLIEAEVRQGLSATMSPHE